MGHSTVACQRIASGSGEARSVVSESRGLAWQVELHATKNSYETDGRPFALLLSPELSVWAGFTAVHGPDCQKREST